MNRAGKQYGNVLLSLAVVINVLLASGLVPGLHTCTALTSHATPSSSTHSDLGRAAIAESPDHSDAECVACYLSSHARGLLPQQACLDVRPIHSCWVRSLDTAAPTVESPAVGRPRAPPVC